MFASKVQEIVLFLARTGKPEFVASHQIQNNTIFASTRCTERAKYFVFMAGICSYIYLAKPKSGAPRFLFNSIYRRPRPVNNMLIFLFLFIYYVFMINKANRFVKQSKAMCKPQKKRLDWR